MIVVNYTSTIAANNKWQNDSIHAAADTLDDAALVLDREAYFASIHASFNQLF